jgi:hypothetical protein
MVARYPEADQKEVASFARSTQVIINIIFFALPLAFAYLKLNTEEFRTAAESIVSVTGPQLIWQLAIVIYFASWIYGAKVDTTSQEIVYLMVPNRGRLPLHYAGILFMIAILFGVLAWFTTFREFAIALAAFWSFNIVSWQFFVRRVLAKTFERSAERYRELDDRFGLEKLRITRAYIAGNWQWVRFAAGGLLIMCMLILAFSDSLRLTAVPALTRFVPYVPATTIMGFVVIMESWMWFVRIKTRIARSILDELADRYKLSPI